MTRRDEFQGEWRRVVGPSLRVWYEEDAHGDHMVQVSRIDSNEVLVVPDDVKSPTADEAWAKARALMVKKFGEPGDSARDAKLRADKDMLDHMLDAMREWVKGRDSAKATLLHIEYWLTRFHPGWLAADAEKEKAWQKEHGCE